MPASDYTVGALFFLATFAALFAAVEIVVRRRMPALSGAVRVAAWGVLATCAILAAHLLPMALGVLSRETALLAALLIVALALAIPAVEGEGPADGPRREPLAGGLERVLTIGALSGAAIWFLVVFLRYIETEPTGFDAASAYLPTAARWLQEGSLWQITDWVPNAFYGAGAGNGSVVVLAAMLPWDNDFLAHLAMYPFVALIPVVLYALARELGAPVSASVLLALMVTAVPVIVQPGLVDSLLDPVLYSMLGAGVLFLVRHHRTASRTDLLLGGLGLGLAFGTKYYGYMAIAAIFLVWVCARLLARVPWRTVAREGVAVALLIAAAGGVWMLRNWVVSGNPLMPLKIGLGELTIFDAPADPQREIFGSSLLSYLSEPRVWIEELPHQFRIAAAAPLVVLGASVLAAIGLLAVRRRRGEWTTAAGIATALIVATALVTLAYFATPYSAAGLRGEPFAAINVRYGVPAMVVAVGAAGWMAAKLSRAWLLALLALALLAIVDGLRISTVTAGSTVYVIFAIGLLAGLADDLLGERRIRPRRPSAAVLAGIGAVLVLAAVLAGQRVQSSFNEDRYLGIDPALDWVIENGGGSEVGLAGYWNLDGVVPIYPSFGTRLDNRVDFVGRRLDEALLVRINERSAFAAELERRGTDVLVVGRSTPGVFDPDAETAPPPGSEIEWARAEGFREVARSPRFVVLERF